MNTTGARLRLTAWYAAIFVALVAVLGAVTYLAVRRGLDAEADAGIRSVVESWQASQPSLAQLQPIDFEREFEGRTADVFLLVFRSDGALLANPSDVEAEEIAEEGVLRRPLRGEEAWATVTEHGERLRVLAVPVFESGRVAGVVVGGRSLAAHDEQLRTILIALGAVGVAGLVLSLGGGFVLAGRALKPLVTAYERQREFVSDASHELRSPLAVIRASADVLLRSDLTQDDRAVVDDLRDVTDDASRLVDDLLALARLERTASLAPAGPIDLAEATRSAVEQMRPLLEAHESPCETHLAQVTVRIAPDEVRRIVRALLENVMSHTPRGTRVDVTVGSSGGDALLTVADGGPGLPEEQAARIFEPFWQGERARTPGSGRGAGLGLAIVSALVERRGGEVSARPRDGGGLEVTVRLPRAT